MPISIIVIPGIALALGALFGCGSTPKNEIRLASVEAPFVEYVERFNKDARSEFVAVDTSMITIQMVDEIPMRGNYYIMGDCQAQTQSIRVNQKFWDTFTEHCREQLIYHELGHCVLDRGHSHDKMVYGGRTLPATLMAPVGLPCNLESARHELSVKLRSKYVHELFHKGEF